MYIGRGVVSGGVYINEPAIIYTDESLLLRICIDSIAKFICGFSKMWLDSWPCDRSSDSSDIPYHSKTLSYIPCISLICFLLVLNDKRRIRPLGEEDTNSADQT